MQKWLDHDKTLVCLVCDRPELVEHGFPAHASSFYDSDLGFITGLAYLPMGEEDGKRYFGHLRLA